MMYTLPAMDNAEIRALVSALVAVSPSGGGSLTATLQRKITQATGIQPDGALTIYYILNAVHEHHLEKKGE